jgi:CheY-like chemotaxis protein
VLVVDDEPDALELVAEILKRAGARVTAAPTVREAMERFAQVKPHVVLSDIAMPDEDGYAFVRRIRQLAPDEGGVTPCVALTAYAREEDRARALSAGFQRHLSKPIEPAELIAAVADLVEVPEGSPVFKLRIG